MQAVIMAGGKGTRLAELTRDEIPKPMVELAGKPLLLWQIERLKENGIQDILLVIGHLGCVIRDYFGDGSRFGVKIQYFEEKEPLGTAGSFYYLKDRIGDEEFLMMSGDLMFDIDFDRMVFSRAGTTVELSKSEQKLLRVLVENRGHAVSRATLVDRVWTDGAEFVEENALSVTVKRLRSKLEADPSKPEYLKTVYGIGYTWAVKS